MDTTKQTPTVNYTPGETILYKDPTANDWVKAIFVEFYTIPNKPPHAKPKKFDYIVLICGGKTKYVFDESRIKKAV